MPKPVSDCETNGTAQRHFGMADVSSKPVTSRKALATGKLRLGERAFTALANKTLAKGDALSIAEIAGIQGAKATPALLPLCHPIALSRATIFSQLLENEQAVQVYCLCEIAERTGVEMEALTGVTVALLNIWDLTKPLNAGLEIESVRLLFKSGGKKGDWTHPDGLDELAGKIVSDSQT